MKQIVVLFEVTRACALTHNDAYYGFGEWSLRPEQVESLSLRAKEWLVANPHNRVALEHPELTWGNMRLAIERDAFAASEAHERAIAELLARPDDAWVFSTPNDRPRTIIPGYAQSACPYADDPRIVARIVSVRESIATRTAEWEAERAVERAAEAAETLAFERTLAEQTAVENQARACLTEWCRDSALATPELARAAREGYAVYAPAQEHVASLVAAPFEAYVTTRGDLYARDEMDWPSLAAFALLDAVRAHVDSLRAQLPECVRIEVSQIERALNDHEDRIVVTVTVSSAALPVPHYVFVLGESNG